MNKHHTIFCVFLLFGSVFISLCVSAEIAEPAGFRNGIVVTDSDIASDIGLRILQKGGTAVDAAVAVAFALAVVFPQAGNIGGGGFMLVRNHNGDVTAIDYRETAPSGARNNMYLDTAGNVKEKMSEKGALAAGVPGTVAGLHLAWKKHGTLPWKELLMPAIQLADKGFPVNKELADDLSEYRDDLSEYSSTAKIFFDSSQNTLKEGSLLVQKELAQTLSLIAEKGPDAFYKGTIAKKLTAAMKKDGGIITMADLKNYKPITRNALSFGYKDYKIYSMGLPSSGGILLYIILKTLEEEPLAEYEHNSPAYIHLLVEIFKRAYAERAQHLGDPAFYEVPLEQLLSNDFINTIRKVINKEKPTPSDEIAPTQFNNKEKLHTTHFSIVDKHGNAVANTYTLNDTFGSSYIAGDTGILMNNEMDDFSIKPGHPNMYGLIGSAANAIEPGKRMLSSMTPTIIEKNGVLYAVLGSPGGSRIITSVLQVTLNLIEFRMPVSKAVSVPRFHHQWLPDILYLEESFDTGIVTALKDMAYSIENKRIGCVNAVIYDSERKMYYGASDPRKMGKTSGY